MINLNRNISNISNVSKATASTTDIEHKENYEIDLDKETFNEPKLQIFRYSLKATTDNNNINQSTEKEFDTETIINMSENRSHSFTSSDKISSGSCKQFSSGSEEFEMSCKKV